MTKSISRVGQKKVRKETPMVVWLWVMGLGFLSYVVARIALANLPHPIHWASGLVGAIVGFGVGWLWYHWRGDVF
jgi:CHASE2 domain-containing sensor protein